MRKPSPKSAALALALAGFGTIGHSAMVSPVAFAKADSEALNQRFEKANQYFERGKMRDAAIELKNVLRENPDHAGSRLMLGKIALLDGDLETAEKEIKRSAQIKPTDETAVLIGEISLQRGLSQEALDAVSGDSLTQEMRIQKLIIAGAALLELDRADEAEAKNLEVLSLEPGRVEGHFGLARTYVTRKEYTKAIDKLDEIVAGKPDYAPGWILRGEISLLLGDKHAAFYSFDRAVELRPNTTGPLISRARAHLASGDIEGARADANSVSKLSPNAPIAHYLKAAVAFAEGDSDSANRSFTQLQRAFDEFAPAVLLGALIKAEREELSQADALFLRYISMEPDNLDARRALASVRLRMGQPSNAIDILEKLLAASPQDSSTRRKLASAYLTLDQYDKAKENFTALAESGNPVEAAHARNALILLDPNPDSSLPEFQNAEIRMALLKASDSLANSNIKRADEILRSLQETAPKTASVTALQGGIASARGDKAAGRKLLDEALSMNPELIAAILAHEQMDREEGNKSKTTERLETLLNRAPQSEMLTTRLADTLKRSGQADKAIATLQRQTRNIPNSTQISRALVADLILADRKQEAAVEASRLARIPGSTAGDLSFATTSLLDSGANAEAVSASAALLRAMPDSPRAVMLRAEALARADNATEAYAVLRNAMQRWPDDVGLAGTLTTLAIERRDTAVAQEAANSLARTQPAASARLLAHAAGEMGQPVVAVQILEQSFARNPNGRLAVDLYSARRRAGRNEQAFAALKDWVNRNPNDRATLITYATGLMESGKAAEAEKAYSDFLKLEPNNPVALNNYAWLRHQSQRPDALDYAERAFRAAGGAPEIADTYGWMLVQYGRLKLGLSLLERAAQAAPDNPEIGYHYAAALSKAGRKTEARTILTGVLGKSGEFGKRGEAESLLSSLR